MHNFLPIFVVNRSKQLIKLSNLKQESFGILATSIESDKFLLGLRALDKPYFIDSGVFEIPINFSAYSISNKIPWYLKIDCYLEKNCWKRKLILADKSNLRQFIRYFLSRCDRFEPDYVLAPDIINEPLLSLHLAKLAMEEYEAKSRSYKLIGVVQVGHSLYNGQFSDLNYELPYYNSVKSFLSSLICEYRNIGYQYIALGGLLKKEPTMPLGLKFGLSNEEFDHLLTWSRPDFVLGGLALTRLPILKKHHIWADSSNWIWWDSRYDSARFEGRDVMSEVFRPLETSHSVII